MRFRVNTPGRDFSMQHVQSKSYKLERQLASMNVDI